MAVDYEKVYELQDSFLKKVNDLEIGFYFTGGTCISRFYFDVRYSDDLDFFCNDNVLFRDYIFEIKRAFGSLIKILIDTRDFVRMEYDSLKVDFVNERGFYHGKVVIKDGFKIDNLLNIFTNKITAIIGRDEPKDIVDLCIIYDNIVIDWGQIVEIVNKKINFDIDFFIYRLKTFPLNMLDLINFKVKEFKEKVPNIINRINSDLEEFLI